MFWDSLKLKIIYYLYSPYTCVRVYMYVYFFKDIYFKHYFKYSKERTALK